jgi:hypothetical protein
MLDMNYILNEKLNVFNFHRVNLEENLMNLI